MMLAQMSGQLASGTAYELTYEGLKHRLGLDLPIHVQYGQWMGDMLLHGSLGRSLWTNLPVTEEIIQRLPVSLELGIMGLVIATIIAVPIGVYSAVRQDTLSDYIGRSLAILYIAVPGFWLATMVMIYPSIWWGWAPKMQYVAFVADPWANLIQFVIPAFILGMAMSGTTMRMTRTMMLEVLRQEYIRTAWAKGLSERAVILRHALKNALIPVITIIGLNVPIIIGGSVIIEQVFNLPGTGRLLVESVSNRDYTIITGLNVFMASFVLLVNLAIDLTYAFLDPRISYK